MEKIVNVFLVIFGLFLTSQAAFAADRTASEFIIGDFTLISVKDVNMAVDSGILIGDKKEIAALVPSGKCDASINVFLLESGKELILFDTGLGGFGNGAAVANLTSLGVMPEKITKVIFTHLHGDHVGGAMTDGKKVFPNADIYVSEAELAFWSDKANAPKAPANLAFVFDVVDNFKKIYGDKIKTFKEGAEIMKGIKSVPAYGHTAGLTMYDVSSNGQSMLIWGDIMHCLAAQIKNPSISIGYDSDPVQAAKTRERVLKDYAGKKPIAGAHLPYPGVIDVKKSGNGYEYKMISGRNPEAIDDIRSKNGR